MNKRLFLASGSKSRRMLLAEAGYIFEVVEQSADEQTCDWTLPLPQLTQVIAQFKMDHVMLPAGNEGECCWVITADTLCCDMQGNYYGKPVDLSHAIKILQAIKDGSICGTGFCVERKVCHAGSWRVEKRLVGYAQTEIMFDIPISEVESYYRQLKELDGIDYRQVSGAFSVRGYGAQYVKELRGSYTSVVGLPMYQVRCALRELGFFD